MRTRSFRFVIIAKSSRAAAVRSAGAAMYQNQGGQPGAESASGPTDGRSDEDVVEGEFSEN